jgi:hypothetical protein
MISLILLVTGCSSVDINNYRNTEPGFDLFNYFEGNTRAWGIFQGRNGELKRQFTVDIVGIRNGNQLELTEDFEYADGERSQRIWRIEQTGKHSYRGLADDIVGEARGEAQGAVLNWRYIMKLPYKGDTIDVNFDDWMFLQPDDVLMNRAKVSKFGFTVGEVVIVFRRVS